jgi:hypothetical protein
MTEPHKAIIEGRKREVRRYNEAGIRNLAAAQLKVKSASEIAIKRDEWDFSNCPPKERDFCYRWEVDRHIPSIKRHVMRLRKEAGVDDFDELARRFRNRNLCEKHDLMTSIFCCYKEFPSQPYLSIDVKERRRRRESLLGKMDTAKAHGIDARYDLIPMDIGERIRRARETKEPVYRVGSHELALFKIEWCVPDTWIVECFKCWLKENVPPGITRRPDRGHSVPAAWLGHKLKQLGVWRLLRKMQWKEAADLTQKILGKPLYSAQSDWIAARKEISELIRSQEKHYSQKFHSA